MISGVRLAFRNVTANSNLKVAKILIQKDSQEGEIIGSVDVSINEVDTSATEILSEISFDYPLYLETSGKYYLNIIAYADLELFTSDTSKEIYVNSSGKTPPLLSNKENGEWKVVPDTKLVFEIIQAKPRTLITSALFSIDSGITFNAFDSILSHIIPADTKVEYYYKPSTSTTYIPLIDKNIIEKEDSIVEIKVDLTSTTDLFPVLNLGNNSLILESNKVKGSWISRTYLQDFNYTKVEIKLEYYAPGDSSIKVYISSNDGQTWSLIPLVAGFKSSDYLVDNNVPLYLGIYRDEELSSIVSSFDVNNNSYDIIRRKMTVRVDLETTHSWNQPYIKNLSATVY